MVYDFHIKQWHQNMTINDVESFTIEFDNRKARLSFFIDTDGFLTPFTAKQIARYLAIERSVNQP